MSYERARKRMWRKVAAMLLGLSLAGVISLAYMYTVATADPVVRRSSIEVEKLSAPLRLVVLADIHVAGPDMPPARLRDIVTRVNALWPDLVLIAGDFISDKRLATEHYSLEEAIAPLRALTPKFGTIAVLGNHDHWRNRDEARRQLRKAGVTALVNQAVRAGPITVGGLDDAFTGHDDLALTVDRMRGLPAPRILLSHSPDPFPQVPADVILTVAGHTHCGQIRLPVVGAVSTMSTHGERYACGRVDERGRILIVSAGLGTSLLPLRLGTKPELWVIELAPARS